MTLRKFFTLTTILFAAFSFVSCSSDDDDDNKNKNENDKDNHEYVDLGLPSGTLWATCNVGASKPEEYGDYFAWGETKTKETFAFEDYKWGNASYDNFTKYCTNSLFGNVGGNSELLPEDDAAAVNWGNNWCTPSIDQFRELVNSDYTTTVWIAQNGVYGMKVTSKKNGKTLFVPAAGKHWDKLEDAGKYGFCWSRSLEKGSLAAYHLAFYNSDGVYIYDGLSPRPTGFAVRPVRIKK